MRGDIHIGYNFVVPIKGIGDLFLFLDENGGHMSVEVLYVLGLAFHLLSVQELCRLMFPIIISVFVIRRQKPYFVMDTLSMDCRVSESLIL